GHVGTIYQAGNGIYLGRGDARCLRLLPDGRVFSHRAEQKIRHFEQGWRYAAAELVRHGARPLCVKDNPEAWLSRWLPALTRPLRHPGNHKYAWPLDRHLRKILPRGRPFPKRQFEALSPQVG